MRRHVVPRLPNALTRQYEVQLRARAHAAHRLVMAKFLPALSTRADAEEAPAPGLAARLAAILAAIRRAFGFAAPAHDEADDLDRLGRQIARFSTREADRVLRLVLDVDQIATINVRAGELDQLLKAWARENVTLIGSIDSRYFDDIQKVVIEAVANGTATTDVRRLLEERYAVSRSRAKLIARDQIAKLNGQVTEHRQRSAGVSRYQWNTSGDERVRPSHAKLDGEVFRWDDPPSIGHPGQDFQCRCVALPIVDEDDERDLVAANQRDRRREAAAGQVPGRRGARP